MRKNKKFLLLCLIVLISIGFAYISSSVFASINAKLRGGSYDVHFVEGTLAITENSTVSVSDVSYSDDSVSFVPSTFEIGDVLEFTVTVQNSGSIDAMLNYFDLGGAEEYVMDGKINKTITYADDVVPEQYHLLSAYSDETYKVRIEYLEGGFDSDEQINFSLNISYHPAKSIAIDRRISRFQQDSWETVIYNLKYGDRSLYKVGEQKEIYLENKGTYNIRIANLSSPSECNNPEFSQTACGVVLEFVGSIEMFTLGSVTTWEEEGLRGHINSDIYSALPEYLRSAIIDTNTVTGHNSTTDSNYITTDKLYLLSPQEIWEDCSEYDTACDYTRQLDYYKGVTSQSGYDRAKKLLYETNEFPTRLRTSLSFSDTSMFRIYDDGQVSWSIGDGAGISPAFRISE